MARTRILYVHHRSELGGAPSSLSYLIRGLDRERFEAHVYCPEGPAAELFRDSGATVHTGPVAGFTHIWASVYRGRRWLLFCREVLRLPGHVLAFRRTLRRNGFDVIHLNDSPLIAAAWLARRERIPVLWHLRSALPDAPRGRRSGFVRRAILELAQVAVAINDDVASSFDVDATVVPNSVDLEQFRPSSAPDARRQLGLPVDQPIVAYFGFLYPSKGFGEFIEAAAELVRRGADASFLIIGGAVRGEEFFRSPGGKILRLLDLARNYDLEARERVARAELGDRIRFIPFTRDTAVLYQASDVVVAPSRGPELGRPVIEAAASGVPVVATGSTNGGGVLVPGVTGLLVEATVAAVVDATESLLADPQRRERIGVAAREHAERTFDPEANTRQIEGIYRRLVEQAARTRVLYVHHRSQLGGAPSSLAVLIQNLDPRFQAYVYCPEGAAADLFRAAGAKVHTGNVAIFSHAWDAPYAGARWLIVVRELLRLPGHLLELRRLLRRERIDFIHLNDSPLLPAAFVAHRAGLKVIWHLRSALAGEGRDLRSRIIERAIDRYGDAAIAIDEDVAARFLIRLPIAIVHNSVVISDPPATINGKRALSLPEDRVAIGFAGFVRRQKGWPELVEAAAILVREGLPVHFVIMGGGIRPPEYFRSLTGRLLAVTQVLTDEESAIKELVAARGLVDRFSFIPFTPSTGEIYAALDVVTFPNQGVGLGRPVLEAAMHGKPTVAAGSANGAGVLLPERTGILLKDRGPEGIAAALRRLVLDPDLRLQMGRAGAQHARTAFNPALNARKVEALYRRVAAGSPDPEAVAGDA